VRHPRADLRQLEAELLDRVNELGIGPQGLGGRVTALGVNIEVFPTHIAGLPVAVNLGCHSTRRMSTTI
jgi:fumarate hydratase subunit alpha